MNRKDIFLGFFLIVLAVGISYIVFFRDADDEPVVVIEESQTLSVQDEIEDTFNLVIPDDIEKGELLAIGDGTSSGMVTRDFMDGSFVFTVLADLPELDEGEYEVFVSKEVPESSEYFAISIGSLRPAKGGYIVEFSSSEDLSEFENVVVKADDEVVLSGKIERVL